ncbi:4-(cytidine 5'-diphospho)-2-C-methyl-D-erythritol kinase [Candidatus Omnitrophota bacterium]
MHEFTVYAPAKLNLYLDVLGKRPDGYHDIETIFEKIDLKDEILIRKKDKTLEVKIEPYGICPSGKDNIVYKAVKALLKEANVDLGLEIVVKKNIPVSAGLGGGSSDAASALRSINERFELAVPFEKILSIASSIGADVGFFMQDNPFAIGTGRGDTLDPVNTDCSLSHVVIKPELSVSTAEMYKRFDAHKRKTKRFNIKDITSSIKNKDISLVGTNCYNVFEEVLGGYDRDINEIRVLLSQAAGTPVFLSGSGPSVFCTVKSREEAMKIAERLPEKDGLRSFVVKTNTGGIYGDN